MCPSFGSVRSEVKVDSQPTVVAVQSSMLNFFCELRSEHQKIVSHSQAATGHTNGAKDAADDSHHPLETACGPKQVGPTQGQAVSINEQMSKCTSQIDSSNSRRNINSVPVDREHKSLTIKPWTCSAPHMVAFHCSWLSFFAAWLSTFAPAALLPVIRDNLDLTKTEVGNAGIAAVCGSIAGRILMGAFIDVFGPRSGVAVCLGLTAPAVFLIGLTNNAAGFIASRLIIGITLSNFVACQFWCTSMFNARVVGTANACGAGLGNMGGGFVQLLMPLVLESIMLTGTPDFIAWRWAFFVPGTFQVLMMLAVLLLAQDLPDGNYSDLRRTGRLAKQSAGQRWRAALINYRTYIMMITYGFCFGVELTMNNILSSYMYDHFQLNLRIAGILASVFGLCNIITRPSGGVLSDFVSARWGMRGRLWALWITQTFAATMCTALGLAYHSLAATMACTVLLSVFCQQSAGLSFGVVPFVSKRSTGLVTGFVGAGGNIGASINQALFFTHSAFSTAQGFFWMGILALCVTGLYFAMYFPMWGGMLLGPKDNHSEEDYYMAEFTPEEIVQGLHSASVKFAQESKSQRCNKRNINGTIETR